MSDANPGASRLKVPLNTLGVAPENLRFGQPADAGIPKLWETIKAAGQVYPILVRPGRKGEEPYMALDGRRRRFAYLHGAEIGDIPADHPVDVQVETEKDRQVAAAVLPVTEQLPADQVDLIQAIGRLKAKKFKTAAIASALGYKVVEIERLQALSDLPTEALDGLRAGRITLAQAKLLTKVKDKEAQGSLVAQAMQGRISDAAIQAAAAGNAIYATDRRVRLAGIDLYVAKGGRLEEDLFAETPAVIHDPDILQAAWIDAATPIARELKAAGLEVLVSADIQYQAPDGFEVLPFNSRLHMDDAQIAALSEAETALAEIRNELRDLDSLSGDNAQLVSACVMATLAYARALHPSRTIGAVSLSPDHDFGVKTTYFAVPEPEEEPNETDIDDGSGAETLQSPHSRTDSRNPDYLRERGAQVKVAAPETHVPVEARTNGLHQRYTDLATRGLIRAVSEDPNTALTLLLSRLFVHLVLDHYATNRDSASTLTAEAYRLSGAKPVPELDGPLADQLEAYRLSYIDSGKRPMAWVDDLSHGEKMTLLAQLTAASLNVREDTTRDIRKGARAEAVELAEMTGYDITNYYTPSAEFFACHSKAELQAILRRMDAEDAQAATLKKDDLAQYVADAAHERRWAPAALSWRAEAEQAEEINEPADTTTPPEDDDESTVLVNSVTEACLRLATNEWEAKGNPDDDDGLLAALNAARARAWEILNQGDEAAITFLNGLDSEITHDLPLAA